MGDFFSKLVEQVKTMWSRWSIIQKLILGGIVVAVIFAIIVMISVSSGPGMVPVIDAPITNEDQRNRIIARINEEGVRTNVSAAGVISVPNEAEAKKMRSLLFREDLIPKGIDPWSIFDVERWTITDFERNVNLRRAITQMVTEHIKSLSEVDDANVTIVVPDRTMFKSDQNPVTASVILTPRPGSDITEPAAGRKKIQGIQKLLKTAIEGLRDENITITDQNGIVLNDFDGMAEMDRLAQVEKQIDIVRKTEAKYGADILRALKSTFSSDRVRELNVKIDMDMSKKEVESQLIKPIIKKERTPGLPYDDSILLDSMTVAESTTQTTWEGTGFNPEGPVGTEGQVPPAFKDMSNLYGKVTSTSRTHNEEFNKENTREERQPKIDRISVSVNIDGTWQRKFDAKGKVVFTPDGRVEREYVPLSAEAIASAQGLIEGAVGYNAARGDVIRVQNIQIDRSEQFAAEDAALMKQRQTQIAIIASLAGIVLLMIGFVVYQMVVRAREAARRRREEELARQHQLMREEALLRAESEGQEVAMSVEDQARMELQEKAINLAKEHPADVAQLIRTWILEE
ncbi:MAG: flagellar basal-body MS-ring/collar protein FliF [Termitinemataceae bacterium]|nr:MAG: flagellar basal-body MS-ring/collar protein FliF [Termitinemataceae bacterium]